MKLFVFLFLVCTLFAFEAQGQTSVPTQNPTPSPTVSPTAASPTQNPTTASPTTASPTTASPTTASPTTANPTTAGPTAPTNVPTSSPTASPTPSPTLSPTASPTSVPTTSPTPLPTASPTGAPTQACGNGVIEGTEQCDPGTTGLVGCCENCQFVAFGTPCPNTHFCDGEETCNAEGECVDGPDPCRFGGTCSEQDNLCVCEVPNESSIWIWLFIIAIVIAIGTTITLICCLCTMRREKSTNLVESKIGSRASSKRHANVVGAVASGGDYATLKNPKAQN